MPIENVSAGQVLIPTLAIATCIIIIALITSRLPLPDLEGIRSNRIKNLKKYLVFPTF